MLKISRIAPDTDTIIRKLKNLASNKTDLEQIIQTVDHIQHRRFVQLEGNALAISVEGINRHLGACRRMDIHPDLSAIREIIDDAVKGIRHF